MLPLWWLLWMEGGTVEPVLQWLLWIDFGTVQPLLWLLEYSFNYKSCIIWYNNIDVVYFVVLGLTARSNWTFSILDLLGSCAVHWCHQRCSARKLAVLLMLWSLVAALLAGDVQLTVCWAWFGMKANCKDLWTCMQIFSKHCLQMVSSVATNKVLICAVLI